MFADLRKLSLSFGTATALASLAPSIAVAGPPPSASAVSVPDSDTDAGGEVHADACLAQTICSVKEKIRWQTPAWTPSQCGRIADAVATSAKRHDLSPTLLLGDHGQRERHERKGRARLHARRKGLREGRRIDGDPLPARRSRSLHERQRSRRALERSDGSGDQHRARRARARALARRRRRDEQDHRQARRRRAPPARHQGRPLRSQDARLVGALQPRPALHRQRLPAALSAPDRRARSRVRHGDEHAGARADGGTDHHPRSGQARTHRRSTARATLQEALLADPLGRDLRRRSRSTRFGTLKGSRAPRDELEPAKPSSISDRPTRWIGSAAPGSDCRGGR